MAGMSDEQLDDLATTLERLALPMAALRANILALVNELRGSRARIRELEAGGAAVQASTPVPTQAWAADRAKLPSASTVLLTGAAHRIGAGELATLDMLAPGVVAALAEHFAGHELDEPDPIEEVIDALEYVANEQEGRDVPGFNAAILTDAIAALHSGPTAALRELLAAADALANYNRPSLSPTSSITIAHALRRLERAALTWAGSGSADR